MTEKKTPKLFGLDSPDALNTRGFRRVGACTWLEKGHDSWYTREAMGRD